jgi:HEAT repeats
VEHGYLEREPIAAATGRRTSLRCKRLFGYLNGTSSTDCPAIPFSSTLLYALAAGSSRRANPPFGGHAVRSRGEVVTQAFLLCAIFLCTTQLWCRFREPPYMLDMQALANAAPIVFRGRVVDVRSTPENPADSAQVTGDATFEVDRVYRGHVGSSPLHFAYSPFMASNGHDCINFQPGTYWLIFARQNGDRLELADDCDGALAVSPLLGPTLENEGWVSQMEADFMAGLSDNDAASRLITIQRLGGLGLSSSRGALHQVVETGDKEESEWAVYALLRTGDVTVLPQVKVLLQAGDHAAPERAIAFQLGKVAEESAVPDLISILQSAPGELTRCSVLTALGEKLRDARAVPTLAAHLSDSDRYARYDALDGLKNLTHETPALCRGIGENRMSSRKY